MRRASALALLAAAALGASGCGGNSDKDAISTTVKNYFGAFASGDGKKACDQLSEQTRKQYEQRSGGKPCATALDAAVKRPEVKALLGQLKDVKVTGVKINKGDTATATVKVRGQQLTLPVRKENGNWKIQSSLTG